MNGLIYCAEVSEWALINLTEEVKWHIIARMIPFVEKNYNICELGREARENLMFMTK